MSIQFSVKELLELNTQREVGDIVYFSTFNYNITELERQYKRAIAEYFDESTVLMIRTPIYEDAVVKVTVSADKHSRKSDAKSSETTITVQKSPVGINPEGKKVYFDLTPKQRNEWLISVYKHVLNHVSKGGTREPMQEAKEVIKNLGLRFTKPNENGEIYIEGDLEPEPKAKGSVEGEGIINFTGMPNLNSHSYAHFDIRGDLNSLSNIVTDGINNKVTMSEQGLKLKVETKPSLLARLWLRIKKFFTNLLFKV